MVWVRETGGKKIAKVAFMVHWVQIKDIMYSSLGEVFRLRQAECMEDLAMDLYEMAVLYFNSSVQFWYIKLKFQRYLLQSLVVGSKE